MSAKRAWEKAAEEKLSSEREAWDKEVEDKFMEERQEWNKASKAEIQARVTKAIEECQREAEKEMRRALDKERSKVTTK